MVGGAVQETRSAILQNPQGKHHGQTAWVFLRRPGWQWERGGPARVLSQTGYVGSGRCFVLSGSLVSHLPGEDSGFKMRGVLVCQ